MDAYGIIDTLSHTISFHKSAKYSKTGTMGFIETSCNAVSWLEIGVPEKSSCTLLPVQNEKTIVAYGISMNYIEVDN